MRKALLAHLLLRPFESSPTTKSAALKAERSSADQYEFVASKSRCGLGETCLEPQSSSCQPWCWAAAAGQLGELGCSVLCAPW